MKPIILIDDMPSKCYSCRFDDFDYRCKLTGFDHKDCVTKGTRDIRCPLKPMPTKKKPLFDPDHCDIEEEIKIVHEIVGYNRCIDEIMGETE